MALVVLALIGITQWSATPSWFGLSVLVMCLIVNYHSGGESVRAGLPRIGRMLRDLCVPVVAVAVAVWAGLLAPALIGASIELVGAAAGIAAAAAMARRTGRGRMRVIVVGDTMAIAAAATRWSGDHRIEVVGGLLVEREADETDLLAGAFGVRTIDGIHQVAQYVSTWDADMVVVGPSPTIAAAEIQRLGWDLEGTHVSLAVLGVLDSVAPHRIETTRFAGATLLHVRSSRPSAFIRTVKATADRLLGGLILTLLSPLLGIMTLLVRSESEGAGIFRQTRVGKDGVPFTMYKMRTMCHDAEARKEHLVAADEGNGVLFKIKQDPRITRVGRVLRKTSLDELPQLINVVKGEMSLVGPRPALPVEVAQYDDFTRRRLAVRPGITGLWQVSGRSSLSWAKSVELDLRYTDNWRLTDDLKIGFKTVDAVVRSRGAY